MHWIYIFLGGGLGSTLRYGINIIPFFNAPISHPWRTLVANAIASFILGFITYFSLSSIDLPHSVKLGLTVGLCGGLSTFSTFSAESLQLLQNSTLANFLLYTLGSIVVCFLTFLCGVKLAGA